MNFPKIPVSPAEVNLRFSRNSLSFPEISGSPAKTNLGFFQESMSFPGIIPIPAVFQREIREFQQESRSSSSSQKKKGIFLGIFSSRVGRAGSTASEKSGNEFPDSRRRREPELDANEEEEENSHFLIPGLIKAPEKSPRGLGGFAIPDVFKSRLEFFLVSKSHSSNPMFRIQILPKKNGK